MRPAYRPWALGLLLAAAACADTGGLPDASPDAGRDPCADSCWVRALSCFAPSGECRRGAPSFAESEGCWADGSLVRRQSGRESGTTLLHGTGGVPCATCSELYPPLSREAYFRIRCEGTAGAAEAEAWYTGGNRRIRVVCPAGEETWTGAEADRLLECTGLPRWPTYTWSLPQARGCAAGTCGDGGP